MRLRILTFLQHLAFFFVIAGLAGCSGPTYTNTYTYVTATVPLPNGETLTATGPLMEIDGKQYLLYQFDVLFEVNLNGLRAQSNISGRPWPDRKVYYYFDTSVTDLLKGKVAYSMKLWSDKAGIQFEESNSKANRIRFVNSSGCFSYGIGMKGGEQDILISMSCNDRYVTHEIGHALGLWHEHARVDRDENISYILNKDANNKICNSKDFEISGRKSGSYDLNSIMHYKSGVGCFGGGTATIIAKNGITGFATENIITPGDVAGISELYGTTNPNPPTPSNSWSIDPQTLTFDANIGNWSADVKVQLYNNTDSDATFKWQKDSNSSWIDVQPSDGTVPKRSSQSINIKIMCDATVPSQGTIKIEGTNTVLAVTRICTGSTQPSPNFSVNPDNLLFKGYVGAGGQAIPVGRTNFDLKNTSSNTNTYKITTSDTWFWLSPDSQPISPTASQVISLGVAGCTGAGNSEGWVKVNDIPSVKITRQCLTDSQAPSLTINNPSNNQVVNIANLYVNGTASDNVGVTSLQYSLNGGGKQTISGTTSFSFNVNLQPGSNTITVYARDAAGNEGSRQVNVIYDSPTPTLTISPNPATATVGGAAMTFSATLINSNSSIGWSLSGPGSISNLTGSTTTYTPPASGGGGTATLIATAGALTASATITINTPQVQMYTLSLEILGSGKITSNPSGINCTSNCSATFPSGTTVTLTATPTNGYVIASWYSPCSNSANTCTITMNQSISTGIQFRDGTPPTINITSPANNTTVSTNTVNVTGTATDNVGIASLWYTVNGGGSTNLPVNGYPTSQNFSFTATLSPGANEIQVGAYDTRTNPGSKSVTVNYNPPATTTYTIVPAQWDWSITFWDKYIGCNGNPSDTCGDNAYVYGANIGQLGYKLDLPTGSSITSAQLSAYLSSEYPNSSPSNQPSNVTLFINGNKYSPIQVIADNEQGQMYTWNLNPNHLQAGTNSIVFAVEATAANPNGLCIYYRSGQVPITLKITR